MKRAESTWWTATLTKQIQLANRKVLGHLFFYVRNRVLDIESNDFADRQLGSDRLVSQQREALEQELVLVMLDDRRRLRQKVRRRRNRNPIVVQLVGIVRVRMTLWETSFTRVHSVSDSTASRLCGTPAQRSVVHLTSFVVPEV